MARVSLDGENLVVAIQGMDRLWALKSRLVVPLDKVRGVTADAGAVKEPKGLRAPGLHVPGVAVVGTFYQDGERVFWDVHDAARTVVIELAEQRYARLVVGVADPRATVAMIESATRA